MTRRIRGKVELISPGPRIFGIITGDDLREYFFIPSSLHLPPLFATLRPDQGVEFTPRSTFKGMRAWNVSVLSQSSEKATHGEESIH